MSLFDKAKKKKEVETKDVSTLGWDAIVQVCEKIYPNQKDPKHYGTLVSWRLGGNDPLDGISIYDGGDYWHFVTFGLSELYEKESKNQEISGYGMEFTLKLKKGYSDDEESEIKGICGILQTLARITFQKGEVFGPYEYIYTGQKQGVDIKQTSMLTGFITVVDNDLKTTMTPNGQVTFVELIGATDKELLAVHNHQLTVEELYQKIGDITDYQRESVI